MKGHLLVGLYGTSSVIAAANVVTERGQGVLLGVLLSCWLVAMLTGLSWALGVVARDRAAAARARRNLMVKMSGLRLSQTEIDAINIRADR